MTQAVLLLFSRGLWSLASWGSVEALSLTDSGEEGQSQGCVLRGFRPVTRQARFHGFIHPMHIPSLSMCQAVHKALGQSGLKSG